MLLIELASLKIKVFKTTPSTILDIPDELMNHEINQLQTKLQELKTKADLLRASNWNIGFNMQDLDDYMALAKQPEIQLQPLEEDADIDIVKPTLVQLTTPANAKYNSLSLQPPTLDPNNQDRINLWLLHNLSTSPEQQQLHRSFLPSSPAQDLAEEQWARQVLKHWLLDDAATGAKKHDVESTNGAVDSAGQCHSARVLIASHRHRHLTEKQEPELGARGRKRTREREGGREKD